MNLLMFVKTRNLKTFPARCLIACHEARSSQVRDDRIGVTVVEIGQNHRLKSEWSILNPTFPICCAPEPREHDHRVWPKGGELLIQKKLRLQDARMHQPFDSRRCRATDLRP